MGDRGNRMNVKESINVSEKSVAELRTLQRIWENPALRSLEVLGFKHGSRKGKTMKVNLQTVVNNLYKQVEDFRQAYHGYLRDPDDADLQANLKMKLADLRNVAGCVFLKLQEQEGPSE